MASIPQNVLVFEVGLFLGLGRLADQRLCCLSAAKLESTRGMHHSFPSHGAKYLQVLYTARQPTHACPVPMLLMVFWKLSAWKVSWGVHTCVRLPCGRVCANDSLQVPLECKTR